MKFYLDSADLNEIKAAKSLPYFAGVTTNPILISKQKISSRERFYSSVLSAIAGRELFVQVYSSTPEGVYYEALNLTRFNRGRIVVKIPVSTNLIKTAVDLTKKGVRVCLTAVSNARQIVINANLGIEYSAIYLNRLLKLKKDGYKEIAIASESLAAQGSHHRILVASLPDERLIDPLLRYNNLDFTLPFKPFMALMRSVESDRWISDFYEITGKKTR